MTMVNSGLKGFIYDSATKKIKGEKKLILSASDYLKEYYRNG